MRTRTVFHLAALAAALTACAGLPSGMQRASAPAHATGEGLRRLPDAAFAAPNAASGPDHLQAAQPHGH